MSKNLDESDVKTDRAKVQLRIISFFQFLVVAGLGAFVIYLGFNTQSASGDLSQWQEFVVTILGIIITGFGGFVIKQNYDKKIATKEEAKKQEVVKEIAQHTSEIATSSTETEKQFAFLVGKVEELTKENISLRKSIVALTKKVDFLTRENKYFRDQLGLGYEEADATENHES